MTMTAVIERDSDGYFAYVPGLKGCVSQGDSYETAILNIREAAELYIESLQAEERLAIQEKSTMIAPIEVVISG